MRKVKYRKVREGEIKYRSIGSYRYYSARYNRYLTIPHDYPSDGATSAPDIDTDAWWFHDRACERGRWDDGVPIDNWTASTILADILWEDGFKVRAVRWWWATYLFGGGKARENGMRRVNTCAMPESRIVRLPEEGVSAIPSRVSCCGSVRRQPDDFRK